MITVIGVDPGFANLGAARLNCSRDGLRVDGLMYIGTKPDRSRTRRAYDDVDRYQPIWGQLSMFATDCSKVHAFAYEVFQPYQGEEQEKHLKAAHKTAMATGVVASVGFATCATIIPVLPSDIKSRLCRPHDRSKGAVANELCRLIPGLQEQLEELPKYQRGHVSDAVAVAFCGLMAIAKNLKP